jgi:hypothetical protein
MLNVIIIVLILVGLTVHRYLTGFWDRGVLPYSFGFIVFLKLFIVVYFVSFIWMFGIIAGIVISALCLLQVVHTAVLWVFSLPGLYRLCRTSTAPRLNRVVHGGFSFLILAIASLTVVNLFVSPYKGMWELIGDNVWTVGVVLGGILVVGNVVRIAIISKWFYE